LYVPTSSNFALITSFLKSGCALLSSVVKNNDHNCTHVAHNLRILSISFLVTIHQAAITGISRFLSFNNCTVAGTATSSVVSVLFTSSNFPLIAHKCHPAFEGSSNVIASGLLHSYFFVRIIFLFSLSIL